ncbi:hypothetical protein AB8U03_15710 [Clostridium sp. Mt-5]|uniref:Uncharacterized protein n=1 Tax=Clostridium moutaii TaxID=3240932 RepID=A0ABV4BVA2_9CLOT
MIKSSKELKSLMFDFLLRIQKGEQFYDIIPEKDNQDILDALKLCIDKKYLLGVSLTFSADNIPMLSRTGIPRLSEEGLNFIENFNKDPDALSDVKNRFEFLSNKLLESTEETFNIDLYNFRHLCTSEKILIDILEPISKMDFDGNAYFFKESNIKPAGTDQFLKISYDIVLNHKTSYLDICSYASKFSDSAVNDYNDLFEIGKNKVFSILIDFINSQLSLKCNNNQKGFIQNQTIYNVKNPQNSIIGNSNNATINNGMSFDEISKLIQEQNNINLSDKQQLIELINCIKDLTENNKPIHKGVLSKFDDVITKHWGIIQLIGTSLIGYLGNLN